MPLDFGTSLMKNDFGIFPLPFYVGEGTGNMSVLFTFTEDIYHAAGTAATRGAAPGPEFAFYCHVSFLDCQLSGWTGYLILIGRYLHGHKLPFLDICALCRGKAIPFKGTILIKVRFGERPKRHKVGNILAWLRQAVPNTDSSGMLISIE